VSDNLKSLNSYATGFVNPDAGDYSLFSGSPAIDAGVDLMVEGITFDYLGTARAQGPSFDIGAYEFVP
jgi:hypothetical protein